jgi:hypothetical protein
MTMSANTIWIRAYTNSDINIKTKNNDIKITCGNTVTVTATTDINVIANNNVTVQAAQTLTANANHIIATAPTIDVGNDSRTQTINIGNGKQTINFNGGGPVVPPFTCV